MARAPGAVRDSIVDYLTALDRDATLSEINSAISARLGAVSQSSVRSYLNLNVPDLFERIGRGWYRLVGGRQRDSIHPVNLKPTIREGNATLFHADCFEWLATRAPDSVQAVVTDPPYGVVEYSEKELSKLRDGKGGVWRIPPSFDGHQRSPLPRFTVLSDADRVDLFSFFRRLGTLFGRVVVPGGNIVIASRRW